jgi:hypothetical protein
MPDDRPPNAAPNWKRRGFEFVEPPRQTNVARVHDLKFQIRMFAGGKVFRAKRIISGEASIPVTEPFGTARASSAVTLPSPQPTSRMCSSPRRWSCAMSSRAQICCAAEFAA